jgi:hypothetical protein
MRPVVMIGPPSAPSPQMPLRLFRKFVDNLGRRRHPLDTLDRLPSPSQHSVDRSADCLGDGEHLKATDGKPFAVVSIQPFTHDLALEGLGCFGRRAQTMESDDRGAAP